MSSYQIAVPSRKRPEKLLSQSLDMLKREGFNLSCLTVFVNTQQEKSLYKAVLPNINVVSADCNTLAECESFINQYYPVGQKVLHLDDDIKRIKFLKPQSLLAFVERMFELTANQSLTVWGIYPVNQTNMYYCKDRVACGLNFIIGCFYGFINTQTVFPPVSTKYDKWLSLYKYKTEGATLRYEGACPDTVFFAAGGLSGVRNNDMEEEHSQAIVAEFPDLCYYKLKANGHPDVLYRRFTRAFSPLYPDVQMPT